MARRALPLLLLLAAVAVVAVAVVAVAAAPAHGEAIELGSRRWLQDLGAEGPAAAMSSLTTGFISYGALSADRVPCTVKGASYYNCVPGAQANPYQRGCSAITMCRD